MPELATTNRGIAAIAGLFCGNGFVLGTWAALIPTLAQRLDLTDRWLGLLLLMFAVSGILCMFLTPWLTRRLGTGWVALGSGLAFAWLLPAIVNSQQLSTAAGLVFLFGCVHGSMDVAMNALAVRCEGRLGRMILSRVHGCFSVSAALGALFGGWLVQDGELTAVDYLAMVVVPAIILLPAWSAVHWDRQDQRQANHPTASDLPDAGDRPWQRMALAGVAFFCLVGEGAMTDWLTKFMNQFQQSGILASSVYASFAMGMAVGRFSGDLVNQWTSPRHLVISGTSLGAASLLLMLTFPNLSCAIPAMFAAGLGLANIVPIVFRASSHTSRNPAASLAFVTAFGYAGFLVGPPTIGFLSDAFTLRWALVAVVVGLAVAGIIATVCFPRPKTHLEEL